MAGETDLGRLLDGLDATVREGEFVFVTTELPLDADARIVEAEGPTLVLRRQVAEAEGLAFDGVFAWLTLDVHSALEAVGLTAAVSRVLADAGISCNVLAGFYHDHLLVPAARATEAVALLRSLGAPPTCGTS
ncbi:MAG: ACT domain-containing protein [Arachnia sp.]